MKLKHAQKRGMLVGGVALLLMATWLGRAKPEVPVADGDALFQVREARDASGLAEVVLHDSATVIRVLRDADDDVFTDQIGGAGSRTPNFGQDSFVPSVPRIVMPRSQRSGEDDQSSGLFDAESLDPFAEKKRDSGSTSWGWLADDVNAATRDPFESLSSPRSRDRGHRFFDDDGGGESDDRFRSSNGSGDSFRFHRQDRRF